MLASEITFLMTLSLAAVLSAGYGVFLAGWMNRRIRPVVPQPKTAVVAAAAAVITAGIGAVGQLGAATIAVAVITPLLLIVAFVDARTMRIPNAYVVQGLAVTAGALVALVVNGDLDFAAAAVAALIGGLVGVVLFVVNVFSGGKLGMGDVKLAAVLAVLLPAVAASVWAPQSVVPSWLLAALVVLLWLTVSFALGAAAQAVRWLRTRTSAEFPFGPYLAVGFLGVLPLLPLLPKVLGI